MEEEQKPNQIDLRVRYEKSKLFRVVHVDGAYGSLSLNGRNVIMAFFSERRPFPKEQTLTVRPESPIGEIHSPVLDGDVFREVEVCATMDILVAQSVHQWLGDQLEQYRKISSLVEKSVEDASNVPKIKE